MAYNSLSKNPVIPARPRNGQFAGKAARIAAIRRIVKQSPDDIPQGRTLIGAFAAAIARLRRFGQVRWR
tara:strand:+ start:136764 stop:136970 length:207 start_codon:yes stop_codon:yes gene_type:complete